MNFTFPSTLARSLSLLHTTRAGTGKDPANLVKFTYFLTALLLLALAPPLQAGTPVEQAVFLGGVGGNSGAPTNGAGFGVSVAVSGETVVVGAPHETVGGVNIGRAYVYVRSGGAWTQQAVLQASNAGDVAAPFGWTVLNWPPKRIFLSAYDSILLRHPRCGGSVSRTVVLL